MKGLNKNIILQSSKYAREAWNDYFWRFRLCQNLIRFTAEERTNYIGDLFNYFDDTVQLISTFKLKDNYLSSLYESVATLQFMYIQQDLIDELLSIFKLPQSSSENKKTIRNLRNELIGHPISRDKQKKLVSSVFITAETQQSTLQYVRYHKDNHFQSDFIIFDWKSIFQLHESFLIENFKLILIKIDTKLRFFRKKLLEMHRAIPHKTFTELVPWVSQIYETFHKNSRLFSSENILYCFQFKEKHPRYQHAIQLYLEGLNESLIGTIQLIDDFINRSSKSFSPLKSFSTKSEVILTKSESHEEIQQNKSIHSEFSKLYENHPIFGISYFKRRYKSDPEIFTELLNMEANSNPAEYSASFEYLRFLFQQRGLLETY